MKRKVTILVIGVASMLTVGAFALTKGTSNIIDNAGCTYGQCTAIKSDGYRCKNCCQQYSTRCWSHRY